MAASNSASASTSTSSQADLSSALYSDVGVHLLEDEQRTSCCGFVKKGSLQTPKTVPWSDVLAVDTLPPTSEGRSGALQITYARHVSQKLQAAVRPVTKTIVLPSSTDAADSAKMAQVMVARAYQHTQVRKRILVLVNPYSGKGKGAAGKKYRKHIEPILRAAGCEMTVLNTTHKGHAVEIAEGMDINNFDIIGCCSGDGVPHEVFNGLSKRPDARRALAKIAVVPLPGGSGNGLSWNCFGTGTPSLAALRLVKGFRTPIDLVSVTHASPTQPGEVERTISFLTQAVGVIADCDLGTEHLRFLGEARFALGLVWAIATKKKYPCDIAMSVELEDKEKIREHAHSLADAAPDYLNPEPREGKVEAGMPPLKFGTVKDDLPEGWQLVPYDTIGNFYCGNVIQVQGETPFFPMAFPSDGLIDLVTINADIPTVPALKLLDDCSNNRLFDCPVVKYRKVRGYRVIPRNPTGFIAIDGEPIPHAPFQAEVHEKLGTTLTLTGRAYEGPGIP